MENRKLKANTFTAKFQRRRGYAKNIPYAVVGVALIFRSDMVKNSGAHQQQREK